MEIILTKPRPCPVCGAEPVLYWYHTRVQCEEAGINIPQGGNAIRYLAKTHKDARPVYGCNPCHRYTKPAASVAMALNSWAARRFV